MLAFHYNEDDQFHSCGSESKLNDFYISIIHRGSSVSCYIASNRPEYGFKRSEFKIFPDVESIYIKPNINDEDTFVCPIDRLVEPKIFRYLQSISRQLENSIRLHECIKKLVELHKRLCNGFDGFMDYLIRPNNIKSARIARDN